MKLLKLATLLSAMASMSVACAMETLAGQVVKIADGDTLTVLDQHKTQHKIRLAGIDAPERTQDFGRKSTQSLGEMVHRKQVVVEYGKRDRYGRVVGKVMLGKVDVNLEQVRRGMAWHYTAYAREQSISDRNLYATAQDAARTARTGIWSHLEPVAPWDFRRKKSAGAAEP